jgi:4-coumarate--CoA ligase
MTETTCSALGWDPNLHSDSFGVGEPNANCEARVMNADGTGEVAQGERGELWVRGPNIMKGYWKNEKATAETITPDGWLKTGDICYIDSNGTFFIVDRLKELIKVKGLQVAPAELEAILLEHPKVADAGVVGVTINGEECPRAYIALREGAKVSEVEVAGFLETKVSRHKRLAGGVVFVDAIPKNPVSFFFLFWFSQRRVLTQLTLSSPGRSCVSSCGREPRQRWEIKIRKNPSCRIFRIDKFLHYGYFLSFPIFFQRLPRW